MTVYIIDGKKYVTYDLAIAACWEKVGDYYYWIAKSFITVYDRNTFQP